MKELKTALRLTKKNYLTVGYDLIHYILFHLMVFGFLLVFTNIQPSEEIGATNAYIQNFLDKNNELPILSGGFDEKLKSENIEIKNYMLNLKIMLFLFALTIIVLSSLFRSFVYSKLRKKQKKYSLGYMFRFFAVNSINLAVFIFAFVFLFNKLGENIVLYVLLALFLLYLHFSAILRHSVDENATLGQIFTRAYKTGLLKIYKFIIPMITILLIISLSLIISFFIIPWLIQLIPLGTINTTASFVMAALDFLLFFILVSFSRQYYILAIDRIK